jgi:hypothetical protein
MPLFDKIQSRLAATGVADTQLKSLCVANDFGRNGFDGTEETVLKAPRVEQQKSNRKRRFS